LWYGRRNIAKQAEELAMACNVRLFLYSVFMFLTCLRRM